MAFREHFPRVAHGLFQAQRNAAFGLVDFQNHDVHFLRGRNDLAGVDVLFRPGHLTDVDQTFDAWLKFNKCTVIGDVGHAALVDRIQWEFRRDQVPRILLQLFHAQGNPVGVLVDLDDLHVDSFTDRQDFRRMVHAAPRHIGDVQQPVNAAQINKRTVFGDVLDHAFDGLTFGQVANDFGALFGAGFFQDRAARHNDVATATVHFQDLERLFQTHQWASVAHWADVNLRTGQERNGAAKIDSKATFDTAKDRPFDARVVGICFFQTVPCFFAARHLARDNSFATRVFSGTKEDFDFVANADVGCFAWICEFFQINAAFHFIADVDDGLSRLDGDDFTFDNRPFVGRVHFEAFIKEGFEFLHRCVLSHVAYGFLCFGLSGRAVVSAGLGLVIWS